jgi:hypothetical protein
MYSEQSRDMSDGNGCMDGYDCWLGWLVVFHECMGMDGQKQCEASYEIRFVGSNESNE